MKIAPHPILAILATPLADIPIFERKRPSDAGQGWRLNEENKLEPCQNLGLFLPPKIADLLDADMLTEESDETDEDDDRELELEEDDWEEDADWDQ